MTWIVGIDEAGYGPNLGPLVMSSVACRVPDDQANADLWELLEPAVRKQPDADDDRLFVADSKVVYSPARGLQDLEHSVLAALAPGLSHRKSVLRDLLEAVCPASHDDLRCEQWYTGTSALPLEADATECRAAAERLRSTCAEREVSWGLVQSVVICPTRFNNLLDRWDSKGAVLGHALAELLNGNDRLAGADEPVHFYVDKHGGRNTYTAMLQDAMREGVVVACAEGSQRSSYRVVGLARDVKITFQPRADGEHFCVALASMLSKYLRELLMGEFNEFWRQHVPKLKPTAGYPQDAARFYDAIRPTFERLGIAEAALWRRK